jgi:hypothetical protein
MLAGAASPEKNEESAGCPRDIRVSFFTRVLIARSVGDDRSDGAHRVRVVGVTSKGSSGLIDRAMHARHRYERPIGAMRTVSRGADTSAAR